MEETRGVGGGGGGRKGGGGMWDEEDEANNDNKKRKKNICILIWKRRGDCFFFQYGFFSLSLSLFSCPCSLHNICVWNFTVSGYHFTVFQCDYIFF